MMFCKQHNLLYFFIVLGVVIGLGIVTLLMPTYFQFQEKKLFLKKLIIRFEAEKNLIQEQKNLMHKVELLQKNLASDTQLHHLNDAELINTILYIINLNGLTVELIQPDEKIHQYNLDTISIHLITNGKFQQFIAFISLLKQYHLPVVLTNFRLEAKIHNKIQIDMRLLGFFLINLKLNHSNPIDCQKNQFASCKSDPFVSHFEPSFVFTDEWKLEDDQLSKVSIYQIKYIGFFQKYHEQRALVMLPNGKVVEVNAKTKIGLEKANLSQLCEQDLIFTLGNKILRMNYST